jgi:hypothetical protein
MAVPDNNFVAMVMMKFGAWPLVKEMSLRSSACSVFESPIVT